MSTAVRIRQCQLDPALILEDAAQVAVGVGQVGLERDRPAEDGDRLVEPARLV